MTDERLLQIRRSHASAQPKRENIPWWNTHNDLTYVLSILDEAISLLQIAAQSHPAGAPLSAHQIDEPVRFALARTGNATRKKP